MCDSLSVLWSGCGRAGPMPGAHLLCDAFPHTFCMWRLAIGKQWSSLQCSPQLPQKRPTVSCHILMPILSIPPLVVAMQGCGG